MKPCAQCSTGFESTSEDMDFYDKISPEFGGNKCPIPPPTLCHDCRQQRRLVWRNERTLYNRSCDQCKKSMIAAHPQGAPFPVFCNSCWWADDNDATACGQPFDFSRPFFDQFRELLAKVPRINLSNSNNENCDYVNYTNYSKDCYLIFGNHESEKCAYGWRVHHCLNCFDGTQLNDCRNCYSCVDCDNGYELFYGQNCQNCSNSWFLYNCRGLKNCLACANLNQKEYCIFNEQFSKEDYEKKSKELLSDPRALAKDFETFKLRFPRRATAMINCEYCRGDYLINCRHCQEVYSAKECQDCTRVFLAEKAVDCRDCDIVGWPAELCYEGISTCVNAVRNLFSSLCWTCADIQYCDSCFNSRNLFGCTGLIQKKYCVLNMQYTQEEYEALVPKIIEHMVKNGEYGEFFPAGVSPFAYDESVAQDYFPLSRDAALAKGFCWSGAVPPKLEVTRMIKAAQLPDSIADVPDDVLNWAIECEVTGKPFKLIRQELEFYRQYNLPVPKRHSEQRIKDRLALRNPRKLWSRACAKCGTGIQTTYAPERPEIVYCEACYLKEVY